MGKKSVALINYSTSRVMLLQAFFRQITSSHDRFQNKLQELRKAGFYRENQLDYPGIHHFAATMR